MIICNDTQEVFKKYSDYLGSRHWKNKRIETFSIRGNKCESCGSSENIQVHHTTYKNIGNENVSELMVLCKDCHVLVHKVIKQNNIVKYSHLIKKKKSKKNKRVKKYKPQHVEKHFGLMEKKSIKEATTDCIRSDIKRTESKKKKNQFDLDLIEFCTIELRRRKAL